MSFSTATAAVNINVLQVPFNTEITGFATIVFLIAETSFALGKIKDIEELINAMEDTKLENMCEFIKHEESRKLN